MGNGVAAPVAAVMAAAHGEEDEFLRILDGEEAEEDLVEKGENGGVGADAEGESQDSDSGETGSAGEGAESVLEVAKCGIERGDGVHSADLILPESLVNNSGYGLRRELFPEKNGQGS